MHLNGYLHRCRSLLIFLLGPNRKWLLSQHRVVVPPIARNLSPEPFRTLKRLVSRAEFHLGNHQPFVIPMKNIDFPRMMTDGNQVTHLVDDPRLAELQQFLGVGKRNLAFKFVTADPRLVRRPLDGQIPFFAPNPDSDRPAASRADVTLHDARRGNGEGEERTGDEKFSFYLKHFVNEELRTKDEEFWGRRFFILQFLFVYLMVTIVAPKPYSRKEAS